MQPIASMRNRAHMHMKFTTHTHPFRFHTKIILQLNKQSYKTNRILAGGVQGNLKSCACHPHVGVKMHLSCTIYQHTKALNICLLAKISVSW